MDSKLARVAAIVLASASALALGCGGSDSTPSPVAGNPSVGPSTVTPTATLRVDIAKGSMTKGAKAYGDPLDVPLGALVVWENGDSIPHSVTADDASFDSGPIAPGQTFSHLFDKPGKYPYHSSVAGQSGMTGIVNVADRSQASSLQNDPSKPVLPHVVLPSP